MNNLLTCFPTNPKDFDRAEAAAIAEAGYDGISFWMQFLINMSDEEFQNFKIYIKDLKLTFNSVVNPYPRQRNMLTSGFEPESYVDTLRLGYGRAAELGVKYIVYGQINNRQLPAGNTRELQGARKKLVDAMALAAAIAAEFDMTFILEPAGLGDCSFCNSMAESIGVINEIGLSNMGSMWDLRHQLDSGEPYENLLLYRDYIKVIHIDNPYVSSGRPVPTLEDEFDYDPFFDALSQMGYNGEIAVEANDYYDFNDFKRKICIAHDFLVHHLSSR